MRISDWSSDVCSSDLGGTRTWEIEPERQRQPALSDAQVVRLVELGRRIEAHFGGPQDIEWCLRDDDFHVVQSRPITTLFPIPSTGAGERTEERRVGKGGGRTVRSWWSPEH